MALDAIMIHKIIPEIQECCPCRINKIYQISKTEILFHLKTPKGKQQLMISCHSIYNRINLSKRNYPTPEEPSNFVMVLRKYLEGASILGVEQMGLDRWIKMPVSFRNDIGDRVDWFLSIELMGKYANIILVNEENKIVDALKRIPPFENNVRTIHPGALFKDVDTQADKKDPFKAETFDNDIPLTKQFFGFSPLLEKEVRYRIGNGESFKDIMQIIEDSREIYVAASNNEPVFHVLPLTHLKNYKAYPIQEGLDIIYYHLEEKDRIRQISGDTFKFVKSQLKHDKNKIVKLYDSLAESNDSEKWREYGDLLFAYNINDTKGQKSIELASFEDGKMITIPLDVKLDGKGNAKKCYNKYHKLKNGQKYIEEQIQICSDEIDYFNGLMQQLEMADFYDAKEIREELVKQNYLRPSKQKIRRMKETVPHFLKVVLEDDTTIYFGKNNLQNDYLTWKFAHKTDMWFHAKDYHGSHVILKGEPTEKNIRLAANIAAYYSKGRQSSSVPVNYCLVKNLKKIPQSKPGLVQLTTYNTIYIDPDPDQFESYIK